MQDAFFQLADGFRGPHAGVQHIHGLAGQAKVHGRHGELHAAAALQEDDGVVVGNGEELAEPRFGVGDDAFEFRRAMAHLHHGHAAAAPVEQLFADALQDGKGQRAGAGIEVEGALGGLWQT